MSNDNDKSDNLIQENDKPLIDTDLDLSLNDQENPEKEAYLIKNLTSSTSNQKNLIQSKDIKDDDDNFSDSNSSNSLEHMFIDIDSKIKFFTLLSTVYCLATIVLSTIISIYSKRILTFDLKVAGNLKMNIYMMYIFLVILALFNLLLIYLLIKEKEKMLIKTIYSNLKWFFVLTQFFFGCLFCIGICWKSSNWTLILSASVNMVTTIMLAFYFQEIKKKKNMELGTFICIYAYLSVLFAFISYVTFYNFSCILQTQDNIASDYVEQEIKKFFPLITISSNLFQTILSIVLLTYFKDFFFAISSLYIELALIVHNRNDFQVNSNSISVEIFIAILSLSCIIIVVKYKMKTFGFEMVEDINNEED